MRRRLWRLLRMFLRPARFVDVRHPHGHFAVGGRTILQVVVRGHGTVGAGADVVDVDGGFDGLISVPVVDGVAIVEARGLPWRQRRRVSVVRIALPTPPSPPQPSLPAVQPVSPPSTALPSFAISIEVP
jgi:hypothetical protein